MRPTRRRPLVALTLVATLLLGACGGSSKNAPDAGEADRPATTGSTDATPAADGSITLTDTRGTVTLDGPATKVVALEWTYVEDLLALGVTPVGVADVEGYGTYVAAGPDLPADVVDVGTRQEPSSERIRRLEPDLIIASGTREDDSSAAFGDVPVLTFDPYAADLDSQWEEMTTTLATIAAATGKQAEGQAVLERLDEAITSGKEALADVTPRSVVLAQGIGTVDAPMFRLFTDNAMVVELTAQLGLDNGWDGEEEGSGFNSVSLEGLTAIGDSWFLPVADTATVAAFEDRFADSPLWTALTFVQDDHLRPLAGDAWFFGGPLSAEYLVDELVRALTT